MFLMDAERKVLTLTQRDKSGVWKIVRNITLPVTDFTAMQAVSFGGDGPDTISLLGVNTVSWLSLHGQRWELDLDRFQELPTYVDVQ